MKKTNVVVYFLKQLSSNFYPANAVKSLDKKIKNLYNNNDKKERGNFFIK